MGLINFLVSITDEKVYTRGVNLYKKKKVHNLLVASAININEQQVAARVAASDGVTDYDTHITFTQDELLKYSCECIYFLNNSSKKICKHLIATFLAYNDDEDDETEVVSSKKPNKTVVVDDQISLSNLLLSEYKKKSNVSLTKDKYILKFSIVILYNRTIAIEFEVYNHNNDRTYKIRNIGNFLTTYINKQVHKFTDKFSIDFKYSNFVIDDKIKAVWEILFHNYEMDQPTTSSYYNDSNLFDGSYAIIIDSQLLKILESLKGQNVNIKNKTHYSFDDTSKFYHVSSEEYNFNFNFTHAEKKLTLQINSYPSLLISNTPILVEKGTIYLLTTDQLQACLPLYKLVEARQAQQVVFDMKNDLKSVVQYLLPNLKLLQHDLTLPETIGTKIVYQNLEASFYLDYQNDEIVISPSFKYGEYTFDASNEFNLKLPADCILIRNVLKEQTIEEYLLLIGFKKNNHRYHLNNDNNDYINFVVSNIHELAKLVVVYYSDSFKNIKFISQPKIKPIIKNDDNNLLEFSFEIDNVSNKELWELFNNVDIKKQYHRLTNGSILNLKDIQDDDFFKLLETLDFDLTGKKQNSMKISKVNAIFLSKQLEKYDVEWDGKNDYIDIFNNIRNLSLSYQLPLKLNVTLREYQKFGFQWLKTLAAYKLGGILADEMGLGKTVQAITFILSEFEDNANLNPVIIISPSSLIYNWENEITKFAPNLKTLVINGEPKKRQEMIKDINNYQVVIISYPLLKKEINNLENIKFSYAFIDEAQYIKNLNALVAKSVKKINATVRFALTGTPIENSLSELWSIFDYCLPGYLLSHHKFQKIFEKPIVIKTDQEKLNIFNNKIKPFILRRLKKDVIKELPEKNVYNILIEMTDEQKKIYASYVKTAKKELDEQFKEFGVEKSRIKFLSVLTRLRQICCDPSVFVSDYNGGSGKLETLQSILEENLVEENKILIFSQFTMMLKNIHQQLNQENIKVLYLDGQTKTIERKDIINKFMNEEEYKIFLLSLKAGGVGLNLTKANMVIHFDPWWNPAVENQATDRAHRIGQQKTVEVIRLIAKGTIEERIIALHEKKLKLSQDIIDNNANTETLLTNLTEEEINTLLEFNF